MSTQNTSSDVLYFNELQANASEHAQAAIIARWILCTT